MGPKYLDDFRDINPFFEGIGLIPAFRYRSTFESTEKEGKDNSIIVVCGIRLLENLEVISWLKNQGEFKQIQFLFLIHPSMQPVDRKILIQEIAVSSNSVSHLSFLQSLLAYNRFVVSSSSSGLIALLRGKQIMRIPTLKCADINPLEDFQDFYYHAEFQDDVRKFLDINSNLDRTPNSRSRTQLYDLYFNQNINELKLEFQKISENSTRRQ
jgi:hypothetical protein